MAAAWRSGSFWRTWLIAGVLLFGLSLCWVIASPVFSSSDETAHVVRAVSLDRGQLLGPAVAGPNDAPVTRVRVPSTYAQGRPAQACFEFQRTRRRAPCATPLHPSNRIVTTTTTAGRYPPLYYAVVGLPSLFTSQTVGLYLMRAVSALLNAAFLALAFATARRWSRSSLLAPAIAVAATPTAIYFASVVNPSGLEISSAIALWTAAVVLVRCHPVDPPRGLVAITGVSTMALVSSRGISLLWPVLIGLVLLPAAVGTVEWKRWLRDRWVVRWAAAVVVVGVVDLVWVLAAHGAAVQHLPVPDHSLGAIIRHVTSQLPGQFDQAVGYFGWLDVPAPWLTWQLWYVMGGGLLAVGAMLLSRRRARALVLAVVATVIVPVVLAVIEATSAGYVSQGRYYLPLAVGVPLVAAGMLHQASGRSRMLGRLRLLLVIGVASGQVLCFWWTLHRYLVGMNGPLFGLGHGPHPWLPPVPWWLLDLAFVVGCVLYARFVVRQDPPEPTDPGTPAPIQRAAPIGAAGSLSRN